MSSVDIPIELGPMRKSEAEGWVAAALAEARALHAYDDTLYGQDSGAGEEAVAPRIQAAWATWVRGAEALLRHIQATPRLERQHLVGLHDLKFEVGVAHALATIDINDLRRRYMQAEAGEGKTYQSVEDLRNELGAACNTRRSA